MKNQGRTTYDKAKVVIVHTPGENPNLERFVRICKNPFKEWGYNINVQVVLQPKLNLWAKVVVLCNYNEYYEVRYTPLVIGKS